MTCTNKSLSLSYISLKIDMLNSYDNYSLYFFYESYFDLNLLLRESEYNYVNKEDNYGLYIVR